MNLCLKAGERIYVNGAVLRVNRKVTIELLNDATFLLEGHVLQVEDTTTPLRQLYFVVQTMLVDPASAPRAKALFMAQHGALMASFQDVSIITGLDQVARLVLDGAPFEALRMIRGLFPAEEAILRPASVAASAAA